MGLQRSQWDVFGHQQFQPVQQFGGGGFFLQTRQATHVVESFQGGGQQVFFQVGEMHINDLPHGVGFRELDVVEEAAAQKRVGQFFLVVGGDEHQRTGLSLDQLAGFVAIKLHAIKFAQQIVRKFNISLVDLIDQQRHRLGGCERLPQNPFDNVVFNILYPLAAIEVGHLAVAQTTHCIVFVKALLSLGGGFHMPLQQRHTKGLRYFLGQHGFACSWFALDQQRTLEGDGRIDRQHQVLGGDVVIGSCKFHGSMPFRFPTRSLQTASI